MYAAVLPDVIDTDKAKKVSKEQFDEFVKAEQKRADGNFRNGTNSGSGPHKTEVHYHYDQGHVIAAAFHEMGKESVYLIIPQ
ncbi:hypothetical protein ACFSC6_12030 [Rufibacter sediminis]|uniref:Uncharacterized protein n=1 Tax=Rufibacter sediminis TaxID=2762756 RepID=A0ABR6VTZ2_9BACT|nr:hypothetical protein [Rufibacter sediminis]MBC3540610.1 hypothetical protein [Rufibacter sediminis]